jgi:hypothetical protein
MARALAVRVTQARPELAELARVAVVASCTLSLMLAGRAFPFF